MQTDEREVVSELSEMGEEGIARDGGGERKEFPRMRKSGKSMAERGWGMMGEGRCLKGGMRGGREEQGDEHEEKEERVLLIHSAPEIDAV